MTFAPEWLGREEADALFEVLHAEIPWEVHRLRMFGRWVDAPRLNAWLGDPGASYRYSGNTFEPHAWTPTLLALRDRVEEACGTRFNSVLANLYRDGSDRMGWHSDDERELGPEPVIASVSPGAVRTFRFRAKAGGEPVGIELMHGSLLRMGEGTQRLYRHELPVRKRVAGARINLTFRYIHQPGGESLRRYDRLPPLR
ncbi:alpha-ketoglutarate-dependent dioxygenase AlkB [Luteibacter sp. CQ10]|uniref:alpha-ketoglutarate-dependent dioxygenase AlkB n=1 Tax=Luteibacter sp. CQ10 TaxID=2805821 RepID=UPI0034A5BD5F